jgi:hypothetical protein
LNASRGAGNQRGLALDRPPSVRITTSLQPQVKLWGPSGVDFRKNSIAQMGDSRVGNLPLTSGELHSAAPTARSNAIRLRRVILRLTIIRLLIRIDHFGQLFLPLRITRATDATNRSPTP